MGLTKITESVIQRFSKWFNVNSTTGAVTSVVPDLIGSNTTLYPSFACRAWVNFNGTVGADVTGTYSQSAFTITVTISNHNYIQGHSVRLTFQSGTASAEIFTIASIVDSNTFTVTSVTSRTTSGNCTATRSLIRGSGNIHSITYNGTGNYSVNFNNLMPDTNYFATGSCRTTNFPNYGSAIDSFYVYTTGSVRLVTVEARMGWSPAEANIVSVAIFR